MNVAEEKELTFSGLLRVIDRRRNAFGGTAIAVVLLAVLACIMMTRRYEAKGTIDLQKSGENSLDLESMMGVQSDAGSVADPLSANLDLQTQIQILKSDVIELKVAKELNLENTRDFQPHFNPISAILGLLSPKGLPDPVGASLEDSPARRERVLQIFNSHLNVESIPGTRLIEIDYSNRDPKLAADVVNQMMQSLIDYTFQTKYTSMNQVSNWLAGQLGGLRKDSEDLQHQVVALQRETGLFGVGGTDLQGKPIIYSPLLDRLEKSTTALSQAELNRILKQSVYQVVKTGNAELISQLSGTALSGESSAGMNNSLTLIQNLRGQQATLQGQIAQDASQFGAAYPKLIEERANLAGIDQALKAEIERMGERAKNDYQIAQNVEDGARGTYESDRAAAEKLNDKAIQYTLLSKEADDSQGLYQDLVKKLKEAGILEGLHSSSLTIVDSASAPAKPSRPKVLLILGVGSGAGLFLGVCAAFAIDAIDNKVQGPEEIERTNLPLMGILPHFEAASAGAGMIQSDTSYQAFGEAMRNLRSTLMISRSGEPPKVLLLSSGSPGEGKSTVSLNLSISFQQLNKRVLLLEADLRRPTLSLRLKIRDRGGLSVLLSDQNAEFKPEPLPSHPGLYVLPSGPIPPHPAELLGSARMKLLLDEWRKTYDFIIIDSPPILPIADTVILEAYADATVLIARIGKTSRVSLERAYSRLILHAQNQAKPNVGVVLNGVMPRSAAHYGYYGYYGSEKYEYNKEEEGRNENS